ncbi:hypothetical protein [Cypionkella sp.]|uniref:hypothetical protein n=1 Tax=Cypionkella sp. TaxID=2811411 RepID=UPI002ABC8FE8|nr:hypothetical protein [Cypionkella sp.]MDZ4394627.1 hypothetical protein [Cypionkella sp.]
MGEKLKATEPWGRRPWLHVWKWPFTDYPNASLILIQASNEVASMMSLSAPVSCSDRLVGAVKELPSFKGMAYCMRDKQDLSVLKVGRSKDALMRMKKSPWTPILGHISHADRSEEMVLVCIDVPAAVVEARLHAKLGLPALDKERGREWFRSELIDFVLAVQSLKMDEGDKICVEHDASSNAEMEKVRSLILLNTDEVQQSFCEIGKINRVYRRPDGFDVASSIWCPVKHLVAEKNLPVPFYGPPDDSMRASLARDLRGFCVDAFDPVPDVDLVGNALVSRSPWQQRLHNFEHIGSVASDCDLHLDFTRDEWEVGGEIFEIDYREKVNVLERFRLDDAGGLRREVCEQVF